MQEMSKKETNPYSSREQRACACACISSPGGWVSEIKFKPGICYVTLLNCFAYFDWNGCGFKCTFEPKLLEGRAPFQQL